MNPRTARWCVLWAWQGSLSCQGPRTKLSTSPPPCDAPQDTISFPSADEQQRILNEASLAIKRSAFQMRKAIVSLGHA